jgi:hypothetical protein
VRGRETFITDARNLQVQRAEIAAKMHQKKLEIAALRAHYTALQAANVTAKLRADKAAATLEATLHITSMLSTCMGSMHASSDASVKSRTVSAESSGGNGSVPECLAREVPDTHMSMERAANAVNAVPGGESSIRTGASSAKFSSLCLVLNAMSEHNVLPPSLPDFCG